MSKICDVGAVTAVLLAPCHWVAIADISKQCITVILTSQVDGVELYRASLLFCTMNQQMHSYLNTLSRCS
jgi:hypothetical protein